MSWIETSTGRQFWPLNPQAKDVAIEDIAHALSNICRFNGHTKFFYSVAAHSLNVSNIIRQLGYSYELQLYGLLHDASEAYICDMPKPIKSLIPTYKSIEKQLEGIIYDGLRVTRPTNYENFIVKRADNISLYQEAYIMMHQAGQWDWSFMPADDQVLATDLHNNIEVLQRFKVMVEFKEEYKTLASMIKK